MTDAEVDLCVAKVTMRGADGRFEYVDDLADGDGRQRLRAAVHDDRPMWIETELNGDGAELYEQPVQPWGVLNRPTVQTRGLDGLFDCLGESDHYPSGPVLERLFRILPRVEDYGAARLVTEIARDDWETPEPLILPLVAFIPLHRDDGGLVLATNATAASRPVVPIRCAELRLGLALVGELVVTVRLPDRCCPPLPAGSEDSEPITRAGTVRVRNQHLPKRGRQISGEDIATAIMRYSTATCTAVVRDIQDQLTLVERGVLAQDANAHDDFDPTEPLRSVHHLGDLADHMHRDLSRTLRRMPDDDQRQADALAGHALLVRRTIVRVRDALAELQAVQTELQLTGSTMTNLVAARQLAASRGQQELLREQLEKAEQLRLAEAAQQDKIDEFHRVVSTIGALVIVPALVAALWGANTWLPGERAVTGFIALLLLMTGGGLVSWQIIQTRWSLQRARSGEPAAPARPAWRVRQYQAAVVITALAVALLAVADDGRE